MAALAGILRMYGCGRGMLVAFPSDSMFIMKSRKIVWPISLIAGAAILYGGWLIYCAYFNLVTLDVRNMEVREVVKKIERQTWESISADKGVQGKVTLNVRRKPLEAVLRMIGDQTFSRPNIIYPLYSENKSLALLQQALRGEVEAGTHGWTNLDRGGFGGGMFGPGGPGLGMFGPVRPGTAVPAKQLVSLNIVGKDLAFTTLAFNRFAQTRVVPEDGTGATVSLTLKQATVPRAVAQLAKAVHRKWTTLYALQGMFGPGGPGQFAGPGGPMMARGDGNNPPRRGPGPPDVNPERREQFREQREKLEEELKQALPAEDRQKLEQAQQERERQFQEMQNMTPEERAQRFGQMGGANMAQMQRDRLLSSTPEQRAQMNQRMNQMRNSGPGGPPR